MSAGNVTWRLVELARSQPDRLAVVEPGGASISFGELDRRTACLAGGLCELGLQPGARLLLLAPMGIPLYLALLGIFRAGCTAVVVDPSAPRRLLRRTLASLGLAGFVGSSKAQLLRFVIPELRGLGLYLSSGFVPLPHRRLAALQGEALPPLDLATPALVTFTTGTSGRPRAMARSHAFLDAQHRALVTHMGIGERDVDLATLPVFMLNSLAGGATCVLADADLSRPASARPERIIHQLQQWKVTTTSGSPAFFAPLARSLRLRGETLPHLRQLFVGGGRVPSRLLEDLVAVAPRATVWVHYGSTEADPMATIDARELLALGGDGAGRGSCVGVPIREIQLELWEPGGVEAVERGEPGEVVVAGEHVNRSYLDDPEADAHYKVRRGERVFHRTGDVARLDEQGRIWLLGRVGEDCQGRWPLVLEALAESLPWVARAGMACIDGQPVLGVQAVEPERPPDWEARLRSLTGLRRLRLIDRVPVDPRHNAKVDRLSLRRVLQRFP